MRVVLASTSPRRREILKTVGLENFEVVSPKASEIEVKKPHHVKLNALKKARSVEEILKGNFLVVAADTAVFLDGEFLGKPKSRVEAKKMLEKLSGRWHTVYTALAVSLRLGGKTKRRVKNFSSRVKFRRLTQREIEAYISTGEPLDKAGAYGVQGFGALFVEEIRGDFFTVMGLPASGLYGILKELLGGRALKLFFRSVGVEEGDHVGSVNRL